MSGAFTVLPSVGDLFVVDAAGSITYTNTAGNLASCQLEPGIYIALRVDVANNVVYAGFATGGAPGRIPGSTSGEVGIPLARIRQTYAAR